MPTEKEQTELIDLEIDLDKIGELSLAILINQLLRFTQHNNLPLIPIKEFINHSTKPIIQFDYSKEFKDIFFHHSMQCYANGSIPKEEIRHVVHCLDINLHGHNEKLKRIKFRYLSLNQSPVLGEMPYIMSLTDANDKTTHYLIRDPIATIINMMTIVIVANVSENDVEFRASKYIRATTEEFPPTFWSEEGAWQIDDSNKLSYVDIYHPIIEETVKQHIEESVKNSFLLKNKSELTIMDVGGGDGQLAFFIIAYLSKEKIKHKYILIEPDQSQCEQAKALLNQFINPSVSTLEIHTSTLSDYMKQPGMHEKLDFQVDIVISSGGPINLHVVNQEEAWRNLMIMRLLLSDTGRIIATGRTLLATKAKDLERVGFTFFAKSTLVATDDGLPFKQKYVMGCK